MLPLNLAQIAQRKVALGGDIVAPDSQSHLPDAGLCDVLVEGPPHQHAHPAKLRRFHETEGGIGGFLSWD